MIILLSLIKTIIIPYFIYIIVIILFYFNNVKPYLLYILLPNLILLFIFIYNYSIYAKAKGGEWEYRLNNQNLFHISTIVSSLIMIYTKILLSSRVFSKNTNTNFRNNS